MIRGFVIAFGLFAAAFALHVVGGATDQGWLFITAVALIFLTATGFPAIMHAFAGRRARATQGRNLWIAGAAAGIALTSSALWAANGRSFAWWEVPVAAVLVGVVTPALWIVFRQKLGPVTTKKVTARSSKAARATSTR